MEYCYNCNDYTDDCYCSRYGDSCATYDGILYEDSYDQNCQYCFAGASYGDNYCPTCGAAFGTVATVEESSYEIVSYKIKESAEPLIEYVDKNGGKAEVSAQVGNRKITATYSQEATEISFTSYTPEIDYDTEDYTPEIDYDTEDYTPEIEYDTEDYTPETDFGTVAESSSLISIEEFADTIRKSAEVTVEFAELHGGSVKVITQLDGVEIITSYTP
ncbi:hypothetical protein RhiirA5_484534 [Rhizophagus irregularis]|uniref:Uncharacterized protein n=3 Tax=Rhizophagus irregularis TaxID=588596 RepID=U9SL48_RHIID|nr:hypothetical protein GLOIN_2v1471727 [Rhizophagus irregularis DAOM 181602=DAOM 197198]EXX60635.1 hypothetical protein RirG_178170 [Rhizophagus irregularis DAOM 197198w]PKC05832.1 hypothetical protein RhiirA5_484534 [Rhizophagus irregularis]PKC70861.1 hypothetical protein RhiirA1_499434 [Rhizophagus irregularis]PKY18350.1 hypothetical protein RhiirB3_491043 [Rhizophagus irregularis]POG80215.1 hypothetical protein GLOIN_2v1471727 [Rhizophagus irregularis DAOM 181602=DAOM 197198]|eukprot:XP_025187081.1 hypothetical protein GLOIN_2v1471727 [Rhizophagus irregularis DAOM 181602=DAOM 197198]